MINKLQMLIIEMQQRKKSHIDKINKSEWDTADYDITCGREIECDFLLQKLIALKNEQPEAITDDAHFCKHDVQRSAASNEITDKESFGTSSSETQAVQQNEHTKEVCSHSEVDIIDLFKRNYCTRCKQFV